MTFLVEACTAPLTNITGPIYHLVRGDDDKVVHLQNLILATLRTATVAAFFFMIIPFNHIFGTHDTLAGSFALTAQFLVHPYAAALFNAFVNGGHLLIMKMVDIVVQRQLILTRNDVGGFVRAVGFCYIATFLKDQAIHKMHGLDGMFISWSCRIARWTYDKK
jgi:hypothetical protein